ncbi:ankyrin repeat and SAM domain-containing protein 6-like [Cucumis melo var. makuwa]|uniref:Ankyrin repeat and SAM domain-containing protein 6-like n=1 Tax=Cucumis melo var. makuwa TaxID=1194695 RepID=A0A5A7T7B2_CUCMM|nr:ankyrin repeat and SAM domain-containing protein 6-like [Cucumis melo var. makuwa]TYK01947.1 ankyrin repeat and SAM domain-containing protein 6-like [Cucumis melo var. makuwa]
MDVRLRYLHWRCSSSRCSPAQSGSARPWRAPYHSSRVVFFFISPPIHHSFILGFHGISMSKPRVTITLGRSGQVVKRGGSSSSAADFTQSYVDSGPEPRRKRYIERSADNAEDLFSSTNKRQRGVDFHSSLSGGERKNAYRVGQNDLRLKLMRKNQSKKIGIGEEHSRTDLHNRFSKNSLPSTSGDVVHRGHEFRGSNLIRQTHSRESADDLYLEHSQRKSAVSYIDRMRVRSPDGIVKSSMGHSPPKYDAEFRRGSSMREADRSRDEWFLRNSIADSYRTVDSASAKMKAPLPVSGRAAKDHTAISGSMQRSSPMGELPLSVAGLLNSLGLGKYAIHFQAEEIDMAALRQMEDKDLKELGIPMVFPFPWQEAEQAKKTITTTLLMATAWPHHQTGKLKRRRSQRSTGFIVP